MKKFIEYLENKIEGCERTKAPYRDKKIYQLVLGEYKEQLTLNGVNYFKPPLWLDGNNAYLIGKIYKNAKTDDDGYKLKAVQLLQKRAAEFGYRIQIMEAIQLIEAYCC